jgi:uncharacterized RDD family membrane protein YckC
MNNLIGDTSKDRLWAFTVDYTIAMVLSFIFAMTVNTFGNYAVLTAITLTYLLYFFVFEAFWSRTPGKYFFGLRVCQSDGSPCTLRSALIRTLFRIFEVNPFVFGVLPAGITIYISKQKQRLGDLVAGTVVVSKKRYPESDTKSVVSV